MNDYDPTRPFDPSQPDQGLDWEDDEGSPKLLWGRVLALAGVLLLAFLIGRMSAPDDSADEVRDLQEKLEEANATIADLEDKLIISPTPTETETTDGDAADESPNPDTSESPGGGEGDEGDGAEGTVETYVVKEGDTYTSISDDLFGDPGGAECLSEANDGAVLHPDDEINVPEHCDPGG